MIRIINTCSSIKTIQRRISLFHSPQRTRTSSRSRFHNHTQTNHSGWVISLTQRPLPDNIQFQDTDINTADGIRIRNPSKGAAADPRVCWDQLNNYLKVFRYVLLVHPTWRHLSVICGYVTERASIPTPRAHRHTHTDDLQAVNWRCVSTFYFRTSNIVDY